MVHQRSYVFKRDGRKEEVHLDKITSRIQKLCYGLNMDHVDPVSITLKVINGLYPGITTAELDNLAAETAIVMSSHHPDYAILAARISISNLHKETKKHFSDVIEVLYKATNSKTNETTPIISDEFYQIIIENANRLNSCIIYDRDFQFDYFAFKTLERNCLLKINGKIAERPQHMLMRVAVGIHGNDLDSVVETYNYLSERYFMYANTILLSAATVEPYLCSSYSITIPDDSLDGIYDCITQSAKISNMRGNVGISIHKIRAKGTEIAGTNGVSNGLVPMLRVFNNSACYATDEIESETQTIYLEPWHPDILDFLSLKRISGKDEYRAKELLYGLWLPDLFMKRVKSDEKWSLMCPHRSQGLPNTWGEAFTSLYESYENDGKFVKQIQARDLWKAICLSQIETGSPVLLYKDSCNLKSNQQNLGTIRNASFSTDLVQFTSPEEIAVSPEASLVLNMYVDRDKKEFDFEKLKKVVKIVTKSLDRIIDVTAYVLPEAKTSSLRHRPIAISVQALADTFLLLKMGYDSDAARELNQKIFETIYFAALEASCEIAAKEGVYSSYADSPISQGNLQYDLWNFQPSDLHNWSSLKEKIAKYGVRNSLLTAVTPTNITAEILGNNKSIEPYNSFVTLRKVPSGQFAQMNEHLLKDLSDRGLWTDKIKNEIISQDGSVQSIENIPDELKQIYKTAWEISQKIVINMAVDRGAFIDHSQAITIYLASPTYGVMSSMHFYGWEKGLKTGMYALKTRAAPVSLINPVVSKGIKDNTRSEAEEEAALLCSLQNPGDCEMCSS